MLLQNLKAQLVTLPGKKNQKARTKVNKKLKVLEEQPSSAEAVAILAAIEDAKQQDKPRPQVGALLCTRALFAHSVLHFACRS